MTPDEVIDERVQRAERDPDANDGNIDLVTGAGALPCPGPLGAGWRCINLPWHSGPCKPWSKHPVFLERQRALHSRETP